MIAFVSKMFSVSQDALPKHRKRYLITLLLSFSINLFNIAENIGKGVCGYLIDFVMEFVLSLFLSASGSTLCLFRIILWHFCAVIRFCFVDHYTFSSIKALSSFSILPSYCHVLHVLHQFWAVFTKCIIDRFQLFTPYVNHLPRMFTPYVGHLPRRRSKNDEK